MKKLIKQYVTTVVSLPEYQFNKLSHNNKSTYLRNRIRYVIADINRHELTQSELDYILKIPDRFSEFLSGGLQLSEKRFNNLSNDQLKFYFKNVKKGWLRKYELLKLNEIDRDALRKHISSFGEYKIESELVDELYGDRFLDKNMLNILLNNLDVLSDEGFYSVVSAIRELGSSELEAKFHQIVLSNEKLIGKVTSKSLMDFLGMNGLGGYGWKGGQPDDTVAKIILNNDKFVSKFNYWYIEYLTKLGNVNEKELFDILHNNIAIFDMNQFSQLLSMSKEPKNTLSMLGSRYGEFIDYLKANVDGWFSGNNKLIKMLGRGKNRFELIEIYLENKDIRALINIYVLREMMDYADGNDVLKNKVEELEKTLQ